LKGDIASQLNIHVTIPRKPKRLTLYGTTTTSEGKKKVVEVEEVKKKPMVSGNNNTNKDGNKKKGEAINGGTNKLTIHAMAAERSSSATMVSTKQKKMVANATKKTLNKNGHVKAGELPSLQAKTTENSSPSAAASKKKGMVKHAKEKSTSKMPEIKKEKKSSGKGGARGKGTKRMMVPATPATVVVIIG
jgi:hypothetical protein